MRNLLLFILLLVGIWWFRRSLGGDSRQSPPPEGGSATGTPATGRIEHMQACAHCALIVPESEGVLLAGQFYCSQEHARLGAKDGVS